jgi:hypothetical protein
MPGSQGKCTRKGHWDLKSESLASNGPGQRPKTVRCMREAAYSSVQPVLNSIEGYGG